MNHISETAVHISNLNKSFDDLKVLTDISLDIKKGEFLSVIGVSGCGKSTLLRIIGGLETKTEGTLLVNGQEVEKPSRKIGFVFQDHRLLPWLTVEENIKLALDRNQPDADRLVKENLELVGLGDFAKSYPGQLSGGMAQRVAIARALSNKPDILLLDEPFGALDAMTRINMQQELRRIWQQEKITMILITHDIEEAIFLGERVVVLSSRPGRIKKTVPIEEICHIQRTGTAFSSTRDLIFKEFFRDEELPFAYTI
ncbi:MAG: ABC transporter ATP-binding protein [Eubacterium sp.]|nr:ABC transporter ATP-binding protein [Eubacterium sp.]